MKKSIDKITAPTVLKMALIYFFLVIVSSPFAVPAGSADDTAEIIRVTGVGNPPQDATNATVRRELTERAALADAERKLVQAITEKRSGARQKTDQATQERTVQRTGGEIKGYTVLDKREFSDGRIEVDLELRLRDLDQPNSYRH